MEKKLVSIIVPVYNVEKYIKECLNSIVNQTYKNIEIILINDGSTDSSGFICDDYAKEYSNIKVVHVKNSGQGAARNLGFKIAKGFYVYLIDSDDYIALDIIEKCCLIAEKEELDIVTFNTSLVIEEGAIVQHHYNRTIVPNKVYTNRELFNYMITNEEFCVPPWFYFYKLNFLKENNISFNEGYIYEDNLFTIKTLHTNGKIGFLKEKLVAHRFNNQSTTGKKITNYKIKSLIKCQTSINDFYLLNRSLIDLTYLRKFLQWFVSTTIRAIHLNEEKNKESKNLNKKYLNFLFSNSHIWSIHLLKSFIKVKIN
jgi:glycosyltransferase involved in cell wall biosynthesis